MADENKFLTIQGSVVTDCDKSATEITIPEGVTEIGDYAFGDWMSLGCQSLTSITIPNSVTKIGFEAFVDCQSLASITIPNGVTEIGEYAFKGCESLADIRFGGTESQWKAVKKGKWWNDGVPTRTVRCMDGETQLEPLTIEGGVVTSCNRIATEIAIPEGVKEIGSGAFWNCQSLASITIPNSVTEIGSAAFSGCQSLASITIPDSVKEIGANAFCGCQSLAGITIPNGVTKIGASVFAGCQSLASITIPDSVKEIGANAFANCKSLASITIPNGVKEIGASAFVRCRSLASITIPDSVTEIGEAAFSGCESLADMRFGGTESQWEAVKKGRYWNSGVPASTVHCLGRKTQQTDPVVSGTANESRLLTIEGGVVTGCGESATKIAIPEGVTKIGYRAFVGCWSLASITIPDSVTYIGYRAFAGCRSLTDIRFGGTKAQWKAIDKGNGWKHGVPAITVHCLGRETQLRPLTIKGSVVTGCDKSATEIAIPEGVTEIGNYAFRDCTSLASITIPGSVTEIGDWVFSCCWSLTDIRFGGTVSQWKAVEKGNAPGPASTVHCTDKDVWWM